jgi:hypothetical protein
MEFKKTDLDRKNLKSIILRGTASFLSERNISAYFKYLYDDKIRILLSKR